MLIGFSLKRGQCDAALNTLCVLLSSRLLCCYQSDECVTLIVECFTRIKQVTAKQDPNASIGEKLDLMLLQIHVVHVYTCISTFLFVKLLLYIQSCNTFSLLTKTVLMNCARCRHFFTEV